MYVHPQNLGQEVRGPKSKVTACPCCCHRADLRAAGSRAQDLLLRTGSLETFLLRDPLKYMLPAPSPSQPPSPHLPPPTTSWTGGLGWPDWEQN